MKIRVLAVVLAVIALSTGSVFGKTITDPYSPKIEIINKAKLPPSRLADALFAKYVLANEENRGWMIEQAAKLNPADPVYAYFLVSYVPWGACAGWNWTDNKAVAAQKKMQDSAIKALDGILAKHPNYLPALYKRALFEPSLDLQLKALERVAQVDKDNTVPYYMMAELKFCNLPCVGGVMSGSDEEWNSISALIAGGNSQPNIEFTYPRTPSAQDIKVTINGKTVPKDVVQDLLMFIPCTGYSIGSFDTNGALDHSTIRELAHQAKLKAKLWDSQNKSAEALATLEVYSAYSKKLAASKPYRLLHFLVADGIQQVVLAAEIDVLKKQKSTAKVTELEKEKGLWDATVKECSDYLALVSQPVNGIEIGPGELLSNCNVAAEEAFVEKMLKELGVIK